MSDRQLPVIAALATTQTLAWASSYYLPAILAEPISRDLGISSNWFFAAFSASLVISGLLGPRVGRQIDLFGGRQVLTVSNLILAAGLALLGASIIGRAQVAARVLEASTLSRFHPLFSTRFACLTHPIGACVIGVFGGGAAAAFALLHGAGNGILTIARGTLPLAIFGPENYGYRLGVLGAPSRICQALAPLGFGLLIDPLGGGVLIVSSLLSLVAFGVLLLLPKHATKEVAADLSPR